MYLTFKKNSMRNSYKLFSLENISGRQKDQN